jgi:hypothetical protein
MRSRISVAGIIVSVAVGLLVFSTTVRTQEPRPDVLGALLTEVRALRGAIEQMTAASARVQLSIGRLQIQEQRVNTLTRQLHEARASLSSAERERTAQEAALADLEDVLPVTSNAGERQAITQQIAEMRRLLSGGLGNLQKLRADEVELANVVAAEQGRWVEINQQLEALDQTLRRP